MRNSHTESGNRFKFDPSALVKTFKLKVPKDYKHRTQIASFLNDNDNSSHTSKQITDEYCANVAHELVPGKTYLVKVFSAWSVISSSDCLKALKAENAYFVGAQGLALIRQHRWKEFGKKFGRKFAGWPDEMDREGRSNPTFSIISFERQDLPKEDARGFIEVPHITENSDELFWGANWRFELKMEDVMSYSYFILCFCDYEGEFFEKLFRRIMNGLRL